MLAVSRGNTGLNAFKPVWLLTHEARFTSGDTRAAADKELLARHKITPFSNDQLAARIDTALDVQADTEVDWEKSPWWELLDAAFAAKLPDTPQRIRYIRTAFSNLTVRLPEAMLASESWPKRVTGYQLYTTNCRFRLVPAQPAGFVASLLAAELDGKPLATEPMGWPGQKGWKWKSDWMGLSVRPMPNGYSSFGSQSSFVTPQASESYQIQPWSTTPGEHTLRLTYAIEAYPSLGSPNPRGQTPTPPLATWTVTIEHSIEAFATAEIMSTLVGTADLPSFDPTCTLNNLRSKGLVVKRGYPYGNQESQPLEIMVSLSRVDGTLDGPWIVGRVELRDGTNRWPTTGPWTTPTGDPAPAFIALGPPGKGTQGMGLQLQLDDDFPRLDTVDIVIVPDLHEAPRRGCLGQVWGEEIIIKDMTLDWSQIEPPEDEDDDAPESKPGPLIPDSD